MHSAKLAIIISYPTRGNAHKNSSPTLFVKTTDFQLVFNFEQMFRVTILFYGQHGILSHEKL